MTAATVSARDTLRHYAEDPVAFCRHVLRFEPWSMQAQILEAVRDHDRVAVRSANAVGKTAVAACAVLWWLTQGEGSIAISTAPTVRQVRKVLWREIQRRHSASRGFFHGATLNDTELYLSPNWYALGLTADSPEAFQGFHSDRVLVVVDESSGVSEEIFEAVDALLASGESKALYISNPTKTSGTFHGCFTDHADLWHRIHISALDTPAFSGEEVSEQARKSLVSRKWVERQRRRWGEASPLYEVRVLGQFPSQAENSVVSAAELEAAVARTLDPSTPVVVAADVARFGSDNTVIAVRMGPVVRIDTVHGGKDTMYTVGAILNVARGLQAETGYRATLIIDDAGVGGGVTDRLKEQNEFPVHAFTGARRARQEREYPNARSESWFSFAERLHEIDLDPDADLAADLLAPRYSLDSQGRRVVEKKDQTKQRLRRSPDRGDAVTMAFSIDAPRRSNRMRLHVPRGRLDDRRLVLTVADVVERAHARKQSPPELSALLPPNTVVARVAPNIRPGDTTGRSVYADMLADVLGPAASGRAYS
jgi:phage terminase large subunit